MEAGRRQQLEMIMAGLAAGDPAFAITLLEAFRPELRAAARHALRRCGLVAPEPDVVDELAFDFCWAMIDRAPNWDPGGALPWTWGRRLFGGLAAALVGPPTATLPNDGDVAEAARVESYLGDDAEAMLDVLRRLGPEHPSCGLLVEALDVLGIPERDAELTLAYTVQGGQHDPSPSHTLAAVFAMSPVAVRKAVSRTRAKLRDLAGRDERFTTLLDLGLVRSERAA